MCRIGFVQIAALKALIETTHGQDAATQKLIAYGKVMDDEAKTVADYKILENGFIVMMVAKVSKNLHTFFRQLRSQS